MKIKNLVIMWILITNIIIDLDPSSVIECYLYCTVPYMIVVIRWFYMALMALVLMVEYQGVVFSVFVKSVFKLICSFSVYHIQAMTITIIKHCLRKNKILKVDNRCYSLCYLNNDQYFMSGSASQIGFDRDFN